MLKHYQSIAFILGAIIALPVGTAQAVVEFDQDVTSDVIFGSGNDNGAFTTDRAGGVELGLRGKLRHNAVGNPENTFNSNGDGTYTFNAGVAPTQTSPTAEWSFEWSINSDFDGTSAKSLADLTYELAMTSTTGASISTFDPIHEFNPGTSAVFWDHAMGDNSTGNGAGVEATDAADYATQIASNNLAQNSWKPHWFATSFDPTLVGSYDFTLTAYDGASVVASTGITVNAVPEPTTMMLAGLFGLVGVSVFRRRRS